MKNKHAYLTAGELAKIHGLNKRTLHYYDEAGIFSPELKGENGYRYYSFEQSMELEHILTLRELDMSIEEIRSYIQRPNPDDFCRIADTKLEEIDESIRRLKQLKKRLQQKKGDLISCRDIFHGKIETAELPAQYLLMTPFHICYDTHDSFVSNVGSILDHLKAALDAGGCRKNCGSYISLEKISKEDFRHYDGVFTQIDLKKKTLYARPEGRYLRAFCVGDWNRIPSVYQEMLAFAEENGLELSGYAYECGLNEFAIAGEEEYITQIEIRIASGALRPGQTETVPNQPTNSV